MNRLLNGRFGAHTCHYHEMDVRLLTVLLVPYAKIFECRNLADCVKGLSVTIH
jgi:hypothetical protein